MIEHGDRSVSRGDLTRGKDRPGDQLKLELDAGRSVPSLDEAAQATWGRECVTGEECGGPYFRSRDAEGCRMHKAPKPGASASWFAEFQ